MFELENINAKENFYNTRCMISKMVCLTYVKIFLLDSKR